MATVTGLTADRMLEIEAASIVDGEVLADHLILTKHDGTQIDAGPVVGPAGPTGPAGSALSVLSAASVLEPGISGQRRAGRVLSVADFTTLLGLSTPVGLFNLSGLTNLGSGGALVNKGTVTFGKGITGAATEAAIFTGNTAQALYITDTGAGDLFRISYGSWGCWFKVAKKGLLQFLMAKEGASGGLGSRLFLTSSNTLSTTIRTVIADYVVTGITDVTDDRWHHVVVTWNGSTGALYVDGMLESSILGSGELTVPTGPFNLGARSADTAVAASDPFFGRIDEAFVTQDILSEDQVRMLYATKIAHGATFTPTKVDMMVRRLRKGGILSSGAFPTVPLHLYNFTAAALTDAGSLNNPLTNNNAALKSPGVNGEKDGAFNFLASSTQYLYSSDAGLPAGLTARTLGCWIKTTSLVSGYILRWGTASDAFIYITATGTLQGGDDGATMTSPISYNDGDWHFVVVVMDNSAADGLKHKLYVDNKLVDASTVAIASVTLVGAAGFKVAGTFTGSVDEVFVTNYALTSDEIASLYALGSLSLGASPKNVGDHVERLDATDIYLICDTLDSQHQIDLQVAS